MSSITQHGLSFLDCYIHTVGGALEQRPKSPLSNCYVKIPVELGYRPSDLAIATVKRILTTTFAGSDGLKATLATCALVASHAPQPDSILEPYGFGRDGKTLVFIDLMQGVWGNAFGAPSARMLQVG